MQFGFFRSRTIAAVLAALIAGAAYAQDNVTAEQPETPVENMAEIPWVMPKSGPFSPEQIAIPNQRAIEEWARSGHANAASVSFSYWNEAGEIPGVCSTCHSGAGFRALYGLDGGPAGVPEHPVPTGGVVDCATCHNPNLAKITEISLPNGMMHPVNGGDVSCMTCHQGRASGAAIEKAVSGKGVDTPDAELRFINPHYNIGGALSLGGYGKLGFEYPGKSYSGRFLHAKPVATCVACHNPHSLETAEANCLTCHQQGKAGEIRTSRVSYDGSGNLAQGIAVDIHANAGRLKEMVLNYAVQVAGKPMVYDGNRHPYFFADANGDGVADQAEGKPVPYDAWTPRMLQAAYNWKFVSADPGAHVHNPAYALELLYDSIEDLAGPLGVDMGALGLVR